MAKGDTGYVNQAVSGAQNTAYGGGGNRFLGALGAGLGAAGGAGSPSGGDSSPYSLTGQGFMPTDQRPWQQQVIESLLKAIEERNRPDLVVQRIIEKFKNPNVIMSAYPDRSRDMSYRYGRDGDY